MSDVLRLVTAILENWMYLEPLLMGSAEVAKELPVDCKRFKKQDAVRDVCVASCRSCASLLCRAAVCENRRHRDQRNIVEWGYLGLRDDRSKQIGVVATPTNPQTNERLCLFGVFAVAWLVRYR